MKADGTEIAGHLYLSNVKERSYCRNWLMRQNGGSFPSDERWLDAYLGHRKRKPIVTEKENDYEGS